MYNEELECLEYLEERRIKYLKWKEEKSIKLELGKMYLQTSNSWTKKHYKIIFVDDKIALGKKVWCSICNSINENCGEYELFLKETGEKYQDNRLCYALIREIK